MARVVGASPTLRLPERNALPVTAKFAAGEVVPTPTFPFAAIDSRAKPDVRSKMSRRPAPPVFPDPVDRRSKIWPPDDALLRRMVLPFVEVESIVSGADGVVVPIPRLPET